MHIIHVLTRLTEGGGSEENTWISCQGQKAQGHKVSVIFGKEIHPVQFERWSKAFDTYSEPTLVHPIDPMNDLRAAFAMAATFRRIRPDIVHTHQSKAGIIGRVAASLARVPLIVHGVHIIPFEQVGAAKAAIYLTAERLCAPLTHAFVHVSEGSRDAYLRRNVGRARPHSVVRSGMELDRFRNGRAPTDWPQILGQTETETRRPILLMLAALEPRKRHIPLLEAFARSPHRPSNALLLFAGSGEGESAVREAVARLGLSDAVKLLGHRADPEHLIALADACVSSADREGLPRSIVQYLAGGKPAFVTRTMGLDRVITEHPLCRVFESEALQDLVDAACLAAGDRTKPADTMTADAQSLLDPWDAPAMAANLATVYETAGARRAKGKVA